MKRRGMTSVSRNVTKYDERNSNMGRIISSFFLLFIFIFSPFGFAEEPIPHEGFIEITENILDKFDVLEDNARNSNFNQLENPEIQKKFEEIRTTLKEYERYRSGTIYNWFEGKQKEIASELHAVNFLYRAYSLSEYNAFRHNAEKSLQKVRHLFRNYIKHVKIRNKG